MNRPLFSFPLFLVLLGLAVSEAAAQEFSALEGFATARDEAESQLGDNVTLLAIGTSGSSQFSGITPGFDFENGSSLAWVYVFEGVERDTSITIVVFRVFLFVAQPIAEIEVLGWASFLPGIDLQAPYADSEEMTNRLRANATFASYREKYPESEASIVGLGRVANGQQFGLPEEFPIGRGAWVVIFAGGMDTAMTCFVSASTGESYCIWAASSVPSVEASTLYSSYRNGAIRLTLPETILERSSASFELFDIAGNLVVAGEIPSAQSAGTHRIPVPPLTAGLYLVRVSSEDLTLSTSMVVRPD